MRLGLIFILLIVLSGCVSTGPTSEPYTSKMLNREERDFTFLSSQLYIFSDEMPQAEKALRHGVDFSLSEQSVDFRLMLARVKAELGKNTEAYAIYLDLMEELPESENVLREAAQFFYGMRLKKESFDAYSSLVRRNPQKSNYWIYRGLLALELADPKEAWDSFDHLIQKSNDAKHLGHLYMGKLMQMTGFQKKAKKHFQSCLKLVPETKDCMLDLVRMYHEQGRVDGAIASLKAYLSQFKFNGNKELVEQLVSWQIQQGDLLGALKTSEDLERVSPSDLGVKRKIAMLMSQVKDYDSALRRMKIVVDHELSKEDDILNYVNTLIVSGKQANAYAYLHSKLNSDKSTERTFLKKYRLDLELSSSDERALKKLEQSCRKSRNSDACWLVYSKALWDKGFRKKAIKTAEKTLSKTKKKAKNKSQKFKYLLGRFYYTEGKESKALKFMDQILDVDGRYDKALNFKAYHLATRDLDLVEAEDLSLKAIALDAHNGQYLDTYGYILFKKNELKEALVVLKEAVRLSPDQPEIMEHLADVYVKIGSPDEAVKLYSLASELYKGKNQSRIGGKIAQIRSKEKIKRSISSVSTDGKSVSQ